MKKTTFWNGSQLYTISGRTKYLYIFAAIFTELFLKQEDGTDLKYGILELKKKITLWIYH
jgi:hypothetical protein